MRYYDAILAALGTEIVTEDEFDGAAVLLRLLNVDGTGSGLDADMLDGSHASAFVLTNDSRLNDARTPVSHDHSGNKLAQSNTHESADTDSATTALHHTLGTGANQACAGNDSRLSDARTPIAHAHTGVYLPVVAGMIIELPSQPANSLLCDGSNYNRSSYPTIEAALPQSLTVSNFTAPVSATFVAAAVNSNGVICAITGGTVAITSADNGQNWTQRTLPSYTWTDIAALGTIFVIVGAGSGGPYAISTNDGASWGTAQSMGAGSAYSLGGKIASNGNVFCATGDATSSGMFTSANGTVWTKRNHTANAQYGIVANGTSFIVALSSGLYAVSNENGVTWTNYQGASNIAWNRAIKIGSGIVFTAAGVFETSIRASAIEISMDNGQTWRNIVLPAYCTNPIVAVHNGVGYLSSSAGGTLIGITNNGETLEIIKAAILTTAAQATKDNKIFQFPVSSTAGRIITFDETKFRVPWIQAKAPGNKVCMLY